MKSKEAIIQSYNFTPKRQTFLRLFTDNTNKKTFNNPNECARQANYKGNAVTIRQQSSNVLSNKDIQACIREINENHQISHNITKDFLAAEYIELLEDCKENNDRTNQKGVLDSLERSIGGFTEVVKTGDINDSPKPQDASEAIRKSKLKLAE